MSAAGRLPNASQFGQPIEGSLGFLDLFPRKCRHHLSQMSALVHEFHQFEGHEGLCIATISKLPAFPLLILAAEPLNKKGFPGTAISCLNDLPNRKLAAFLCPFPPPALRGESLEMLVACCCISPHVTLANNILLQGWWHWMRLSSSHSLKLVGSYPIPETNFNALIFNEMMAFLAFQ